MKTFLHYPNTDPQKIYNDFLHDLKKSSQGEKTSLRWIINQLPEKQNIEENTLVQVLVVGGTVCKSALVKKTREGIEILSERDIPKPSFPTGESFLAFVSNSIDKSVDTVVINSADTIQPVMQGEIMDGIFLVSSKENKMEGLLGKKLGQEISDYFSQTKGRNIQVHIANDTVCLLLSGLTKYPSENLAAGIMGTGVNIAIFLDNRTVINVEAGGYTNISQSEPGKEIDATSSEVGQYLFEKETAGGYLWRHFNYWIKKEQIDAKEIQKTSELSDLVHSDKPEVGELAKELLAYSATLFACQLAAVTSFLKRDTTFVMQGSLFWKGYRYKEVVEEVVKELEPTLKTDFVEIEHADIVGGAKVIL